MSVDDEIVHLGTYTKIRWDQDKVMPCLCGFVIMYYNPDRHNHNAYFKDYWQDPEQDYLEKANCDGCILMLLTLEE